VAGGKMVVNVTFTTLFTLLAAGMAMPPAPEVPLETIVIPPSPPSQIPPPMSSLDVVDDGHPLRRQLSEPDALGDLGSGDEPAAIASVSVGFVASGSPSDYDDAARTLILGALSDALGLGETPPAGSTLSMTAASVNVEAVFPAATVQVAHTAQTAQASIASVGALQSVITSAGVTMSVTTAATVTVAAPPPAAPPEPPAPPPASSDLPLPTTTLAVPASGGLSSFTLYYSVVYDFFYEGESHPFSRWLSEHVPEYLGSAYAVWIWVLFGLTCVCLPYICFQNHICPHNFGKWVGRLYFVPCLPCTIYGNKKTFKGRWWAYVDDGAPPVILGQAPLFHTQLRELETLGVSAIVNLCDEFKGPSRTYRKNGMSLLWLKTVDHLEPTVEAMRTACSFIEHHRKRGAGVYIHCKSGRGRSAAIAMAWLIQVKRMRPLEANQHLLRVRKVRDKLFLQKNVIQFYEDIRDAQNGAGAPTRQASADGLGQSVRTMSFATPWRRNSLQAGRDVLQGASNASKLYGTFRNLGTMAEGGGFGMDDAPPDWDARDQGGVWEVNVAPLKPAIPESLPTWAQDEQMQYNQQQQQYHLNAGTTPARGFGAAFGSTFSRAFAPIPGLGGDGGGYGGGYGGHRSFDQQMTDTNNRTDEAGRKPSLVSTNL